MATLPSWPCMMRQSLAAKYCDLTVAEFEREVSTGRLPAPVTLGNGERWSRAQLDKALAILTGDSKPDWRKGSPLYKDEAA